MELIFSNALSWITQCSSFSPSVLESSIINKVIRTIVHLYIFLRKILQHKKRKTSKKRLTKQTTFPSFEVFVYEKIVAFVV